MWGEDLEEDLYDDSIPFYDNELAKRETQMRQKKLQEIQNQYPPSRSENGINPKLKRKVIYVYEKEDQNNVK